MNPKLYTIALNPKPYYCYLDPWKQEALDLRKCGNDLFESKEQNMWEFPKLKLGYLILGGPYN